MKKILSLILLCAIFLSIFNSCAAEDNKPKSMHKIIFKDEFKCDKAKAIFINSSNRKTLETDMKLEKENDDYKTFYCYGDTSKYNKVIFDHDDDKTPELAFNELIAGWRSGTYGVFPCAEGKEYNDVKDYDSIKFKFKTYEKYVNIWKPDDYNPKSKKKYSVIYLLDGQNMLDRKTSDLGSWFAADSVISMMSVSDYKAIIVAIETPELTRYNELEPDLGKPEDTEYTQDERDGNIFSDFVAEKIVPYVEKHYNVYTDPANNSIAGSSLGGLESFYIGMEHPEKFGTIGPLSPSFWLYSEKTWNKYLSKKDFKKNKPFIYMYAGGNKDNKEYAEAMMKLLDKLNYPKNKMFIDIYDKGNHAVPCWRAILPEFLKSMFKQRIF